MGESLLCLINSKGRIIFNACYANDNNSIYVNHEDGSGIYYKPEDIFLSAACCWNDNPSCKITGKYLEDFKQYCEKLNWLIPKIK